MGIGSHKSESRKSMQRRLVAEFADFWEICNLFTARQPHSGNTSWLAKDHTQRIELPPHRR